MAVAAHRSPLTVTSVALPSSITDALITAGYRSVAWLSGVLPRPLLAAAVQMGAGLAVRVAPRRADALAGNLERAHGRPLNGAERRRCVREGFANYGRYWVESFRLHRTPVERIDANLQIGGYEHLEASLQRGRGTIVVMPHLGGWEAAAYWFTGIAGHPLTVVVEDIKPDGVRKFFLELREGLGMEVVALGDNPAKVVLQALGNNRIVCLLADRDIEGNGVEVEFFGEYTTVPAGPAVLALRTGASIIPLAIYFDGDGHRAVVRPPLATHRQGSFRSDVARVSQAVTDELAALIAAAPNQWHVLQPNWPADTPGGPPVETAQLPDVNKTPGESACG